MNHSVSRSLWLLPLFTLSPSSHSASLPFCNGVGRVISLRKAPRCCSRCQQEECSPTWAHGAAREERAGQPSGITARLPRSCTPTSGRRGAGVLAAACRVPSPAQGSRGSENLSHPAPVLLCGLEQVVCSLGLTLAKGKMGSLL